VTFYCDKVGDIQFVSAVGATGVQAIGNNSEVGYWVMWVTGQFTDGSNGSWVTKCEHCHSD